MDPFPTAGVRPVKETLPTQRSAQKNVTGVSQSQFYGKPAANPNQANQNSDTEIRAKAEQQMKAALEKVQQEKEDQELPNAGEVAKKVEEALFNLHGETVLTAKHHPINCEILLYLSARYHNRRRRISSYEVNNTLGTLIALHGNGCLQFKMWSRVQGLE